MIDHPVPCEGSHDRNADVRESLQKIDMATDKIVKRTILREFHPSRIDLDQQRARPTCHIPERASRPQPLKLALKETSQPRVAKACSAPYLRNLQDRSWP